jgi:hypothetical protein
MNGQVPLRSATSLLKSSWAKYKQHASVLVPIMLIAGAGLYLQFIFLLMGSNSHTTGGTIGTLGLIGGIIYLVGTVWGVTALVNLVRKLDQPTTIGQAFSSAKPFIWPIVITGILAGIFTIIGLILLVIPGLIVGVWLSFSMFVVVNENKSGMDALKASKTYVTGYWWTVFLRLLVIGVLVGVAASIAGTIGKAIGGEDFRMLFNSVVALILVPLALIYEYELYLNVKSVKSGTVEANVVS